MQRVFINYSFKLVKYIGDIVIINLCLILGYGLKFKLYLLSDIFNVNIPIMDTSAQIEPYISVLFIYTLLMLVALYFADVYKPGKGVFAEIEEVIKIGKGVFIGVLEVMAFTFIYQKFPQSRYVLFYSGILTILFLSCFHLFILRLQKYFRSKGLGTQRIIIVGTDSMGLALAERMIKNPIGGYQVVGFIDDNVPKNIPYNIENDFKYLGKYSDFGQLIENYRVDSVFITTTSVIKEEMESWYDICENRGVNFLMIPDYLELMTTSIDISEIDGVPIISVRNVNKSWLDKLLVRVMDLAIAIPMILLTSPIMIVTAMMIKWTSPGRIIYKQERNGINSKPFMMYKFRSMQENVESTSGPKIVTNREDVRVTSVGKFIRKYSIDELPQLFNVLKGDMSIVGPRPERQYYYDKFKDTIPGFSKRVIVKPGITGWAQINGRAALSNRMAEKLRYDLFYIENWSIVFDIKIILKTFFKVLFPKEAY